MNTLSITLKDLQIFLKDRGSVLMLFLLPFVLIVMFSLVGQNVSTDSGGNEPLPLTVSNRDPGGQATQAFLDGLKSTGKVELVFKDPADVEDKLNQAALRYALLIPAGFSADLAAGKQTTLRLMLHPQNSPTQILAVERAVMRASREYLMMEYLEKGLTLMGQMQAANPKAAEIFSEQKIQQQVEAQKISAAARPLVEVVETIPAALKEEQDKVKEGQPGLGQYSVLGMVVLFVFLSAPTTAQSFFKEKRQGSFRRLIAAPVSKASLLAGKLLPNLILCLVQIVVIFIAGGYAIRILGIKPLDLGGDPLGLVVVSFAVALCATSLGIFLAAIGKTEGQVSGLGTLILFMAALLAGSLIPLFMFPSGLENMARLVPHYWANQAFYGLIFRGQTLADVWPSVAALLAFTLVFFGIGLWRFKFD